MDYVPFLINDANLPATLTAQPMTDEEFSAFCAEHPDLNFEMTAEGEIIVMPPAYSDAGAGNSCVVARLFDWSIKDLRGVVCDSSTGFVLPNGARRSPDASWTLKSRVQELGAAKRKAFWHLCPDFVIEVSSDSDRLKALQRKMVEYVEQGAQLGWLIDPANKTVEIYRPGGKVERGSQAVLGSSKTANAEPPRSVLPAFTVEKQTDINKLEGVGPVAGFVLDLIYVWDPLAD